MSSESLSKPAIEDPQGSLSRSDMCQGHGVHVHYLNAEDLGENESEQAHEKRLGQDVLRMAREMMKRVDEKRIRRQGAARGYRSFRSLMVEGSNRNSAVITATESEFLSVLSTWWITQS
jgi:hypothetical protein